MTGTWDMVKDAITDDLERLNAGCNAMMADRQRIKDAALALLDATGDADQGPQPHYADEWFRLHRVLRGER